MSSHTRTFLKPQDFGIGTPCVVTGKIFRQGDEVIRCPYNTEIISVNACEKIIEIDGACPHCNEDITDICTSSDSDSFQYESHISDPPPLNTRSTSTTTNNKKGVQNLTIIFGLLILVFIIIAAMFAIQSFTSVLPLSKPVSSSLKEQILFTSERDGNAEIYMMDVDGTGQTNLTNSPTEDYWPQLSPDGTQIAFHSYAAGQEPPKGNAAIFLMELNSPGNPRRLTDTAGSDKFPSWSPDGKKLVFASNRDGITENDYDLFTIYIDGTHLVKLTDSSAKDYYPHWGSDNFIVFSSNRDGEDNIYIIGENNTDFKQLTNRESDDFMASWSPDGKQIAFQSDTDINNEIWIMNKDGSDLHKILEGGGQPRWSPDGSRIVFVTRPTGDREIFTMAADGTDQTKLTNSTIKDDWDPNWGIANIQGVEEN